MAPELIDPETVPNQFGLYWRFTEWPSIDPEDDITINHLTDDTFGPVELSSNPFAPYLNVTVYQLMNWFYQTSVKSLADMDALVNDMLQAPDFNAIHLEDFSASCETKCLNNDPIHPTSDAWLECTVKIQLPKTYAQF
jgi:hypothetical protein